MTHYYDLSKLDGCFGLIANPGDEIVCTGTRIHMEPAKYRGVELARKLAAENDFRFWFDDAPPTLLLYTVPQLEIVGYDSRGGLFAGALSFTLGDPEPLYYIGRDRRCFLITSDSRDFIGMGSTWPQRMVPTGVIEVFASFEQARERYPINRPENHDELMNILRGETP